MKTKTNLRNIRVSYVLFYSQHKLRILYAVLRLSNQNIFSIAAKLGDKYFDILNMRIS